MLREVEVNHSNKYKVVRYLEDNSIDYGIDEGMTHCTITVNADEADLESIEDHIEELNVG